MNTQILTRPLATLATLLSLSLATATSLQAEDERSTYDLDGITSIEFSITRGDVAVVGSDRVDLELTLEKPMMGFDPDTIEQNVEKVGDTLVIEIKYEKTGSSWWSSNKYKGYTKAFLELPADISASIKTSGGNVSAESLHAPLKLQTSGGNIDVKDIDAPINVRTSGGNIQLAQINGEIYAQTSGGNVRAENIEGRTELRTSGGKIKISGAVSALKAHTSGGSIEADLKTALLEPLELNTSGGNISATLEKGLSASASLSTSGGSVSIRIPEEQAFDLFAKSNGGNVSLRHPGTFQGTLKKNRVDGTINGGGPRVKMTTNGGGVRITSI